jgi:CDP-diacylglycerol--glycerol-3-phosphate 3-phosphatidyltransferase
MISKYGREFIAVPLSSIARWIESTGLTPNMLTLIGFGLTVAVAAVLASGQLFLGGWLLIAAALFDTLDGAVARISGKTTRFGAFLDSVMDRYSEAVTLLAIAAYYLTQPEPQLPVMLVIFALAGSLMVSYARARAEGLGIDCKEGFFQRTERIVVLIVGLIFGWLLPVLWILAVGTNLTAIQRIVDVYRNAGDTARP